MAKEIKIPIADQTTKEVRIVSWKKNPGDEIKQGEIIMEVETDKSVVEVEAMSGGVLLKTTAAVNDMVPVGEVVGYIGQAGEKVDAKKKENMAGPPKIDPPKAAAAEAAGTAAAPQTGALASPVARKVAESIGVDLSSLRGSGAHGKIMRRDVEAAFAPAAGPEGRVLASPNARRLAGEMRTDLARIRGTGPGGRIVGRDVKSQAASAAAAPRGQAPAQPAAGQPQPGTKVPMTKMRRAIGNNLQYSFRDIPHFYVTMSVAMSRAAELREKINLGRPKERKISVNDLVLRATAVSLRRFPGVNSRLEEDSVHYLADVNLGVATSVEAGLVVPVITGADKRTLDELSAEAKRIVAEARGGKIIGSGKGTFTVTNLGMYGVDEFNAIINPPEAGILAVGAMKNEVVDIGGGIGVRPMMRLTFSCDHRIVDGVMAAQFLQSIKKYLEEEISAEG